MALHELLNLASDVNWIIEQNEVTRSDLTVFELKIGRSMPAALKEAWAEIGAFKVWHPNDKRMAANAPFFSVLHPIESEHLIKHPHSIYFDPFPWVPIIQAVDWTLGVMHPDREMNAIIEPYDTRVLAKSLREALRLFREDHDFVQRDYEDQLERDREEWIQKRDQLLTKLSGSPSSVEADENRAKIKSLEEKIATPFSRIRTAAIVDDVIQAVGATSKADMKAVMARLKQVERIDISHARSIAAEKLGSNANLAR